MGTPAPTGGIDEPSRCREGRRTVCAPTGCCVLQEDVGWRRTARRVVAPYRAGASDMVRENGCRSAPLAGSVRPSFPGAVGVDRAGAQCAPLQPLPANTAAFTAQRTAKRLTGFGGKSGEGGRAAAAVYNRAIDGGILSKYHHLCESNRRRGGRIRLDARWGNEGGARLGVLRGERMRAVTP